MNRDRRDAVIARAVRDRKIAASRADEYRAMYDADPVNIDHLLTAPVARGGLMAATVPATTDAAGEAEYPTSWLPELAGHQVSAAPAPPPAPASSPPRASTGGRKHTPQASPAVDDSYPTEWIGASRATGRVVGFDEPGAVAQSAASAGPVVASDGTPPPPARSAPAAPALTPPPTPAGRVIIGED